MGTLLPLQNHLPQQPFDVIDTEIHGCRVRLRFPSTDDNDRALMQTTRDILFSADIEARYRAAHGADSDMPVAPGL
jgi:hypothetical protein